MAQVVRASREIQPVLLRRLADHLLDHLCRLVSDELPVQEVPEAGIISENQDMPHKWIDRTWIHGAKGWAAELASPARELASPARWVAPTRL